MASGACANRVCFRQSLSTGKERDTESGNDYFEARYYSSNLGRFMSPDWSAKEEPIPYAKMENPQSLNLYAYVGNNPTSEIDADGHCDSDDHTCQQRNDDWNSAHEIANFAAGALNAFASDNALGAGRQQQTTTAGQIGAAVGDFTAAAAGAGEALLGSGGELAGVALDTTGVGAIAGIPLNVASAAVIAQGSAAAVEGVTHLALAASSTSGETSAAASGREAHKAYDPGAGFSKEVRLPSGKRPDAVNHAAQTVKELKPNNPSAIARGQRQVEGYRKELQRVFGGIWKSVVETYSK